jgi:predicted dehydrogenase
MSPVSFAIIGAGWRSEFFLRIARLMPERFRITGMVIRDAEKARVFEQKWGVTSCRTVDELVRQGGFSFVVISVPRAVASAITLELAQQGIPVLCETPPGVDLDSLISLNESVGIEAKIQIAEQYIFQPNHAARLALVKSGKLGTISQAQVSACHDYHGMSLLRHFLGITYEDAEIQAHAFTSPIVQGIDHNGNLNEHKIVPSHQVIAYIRFADQLAVYDFTYDQYFSWIRTPRMLIRGEKGEINNFQIKYLQDYKTPVELELKRTNAGEDGNLEGFYLKGILAGEQYVYLNPFIPGRLTDDEIAIATSLLKMEEYVNGGDSFYSLAEASQDHYLSLMIQRAVTTGETVSTSRQVWANR